MTRTKALHHIHRKDDELRRTHAWFVLIQRENLNLRQSFSDAQWGGKRKALAAAKAWRDEHMDSQAQYVFEMAQRTIVRRNNRSGTAGVGRYERKARDGRRASAFWLATWVDETGVHRTKKFSVGRWGESMAEQMALEVREREMRNAVAKRTGVEG